VEWLRVWCDAGDGEMQDVRTKCLVALLGGSYEMPLARFYVWLWGTAGL
jgi:hypothetical protein